jgi:transposase
VDGRGTPLAIRLTGANRNESLEAMGSVDDIPPIRGRRGRPRRKPKALYGDRQYGTPRNRKGLKERRIKDYLARQRTPHGSGLGKVRWVVERTISWVKGLRRMRVRYDRLLVMRMAWTTLAASVICYRLLHDELPNTI